jgi:hypothetical protein
VKRLVLTVIAGLFITTSVSAKDKYSPRFRIKYRNSRGVVSSTQTIEGKRIVKYVVRKNDCLKDLIASLRAGIYKNETIRNAVHQISTVKGFNGVEYELFLYATTDGHERNALCDFSLATLIVRTKFNTIDAASTYKITKTKVPLYEIFKATVVSGKQALLLK